MYLGTSAGFSLPPLMALIESGFEVCGVLMPAPRIRSVVGIRLRAAPKLPVIAAGGEPTISHLAGLHGVPLFEIGALTYPLSYKTIQSLRPDVICVACFPWLLPRAVLDIPPLGAINLHPSLLPVHRGPAPLFWTFRYGERSAGVTVHLMDERLDTGDILCQETVSVPDGISGEEMERLCARVGARLMVSAVQALSDGVASGRKQEAAAGSYEPWPSEADFVVTTDRSAGWAYNFIRGVNNWGTAPKIRVHDRLFQVQAAVGCSPEATLEQPYSFVGAELWVQCNPGVLRVTIR